MNGVDTRLGEYRIDRQYCGDLVLTTGKIIATDPFVFSSDDVPFARTVQPGRYPVTACVVRRFEDSREVDWRVGYAFVQFKPGVPERWEMAVRTGEDVATLKPGIFFSYCVDSANASFMDMALREHVGDVLDNDAFKAVYTEPLRAALNETDPSMANLEVDPATGLNVVAFQSAFGEDCYPCYWGLNEYDEAVCLLTDFRMFASDDES